MDSGATIAAIAAGVAGAGLMVTGISVLFNTQQIFRDRKINTLEYVTAQFDRLAQLGAREKLRRMGDKDIREYIKDDARKTQLMLEYVYTFNRIGTGISKRALNEDVVFNIWTPAWFEGHWKRFEPLVQDERARRGEQARWAYAFFEWLAKEKCPEVARKYPALN
jgi:hypothetical protein